jgi:hypothetical protein
MRIIIKKSAEEAGREAQSKRILEAYRKEELNPDSRLNQRRASSKTAIRDSWESFPNDTRIK